MASSEGSTRLIPGSVNSLMVRRVGLIDSDCNGCVHVVMVRSACGSAGTRSAGSRGSHRNLSTDHFLGSSS